MLNHLSIRNFTLVDQLDLDFKAGMTVITGETGAGKSILLDALSQSLGSRADGQKVRAGTKRADIHASFDISRIPSARHWLAEQELLQEESPEECLLRRVVTAEGRSKAFVNARPVTLQQLRELGEQLIDLHSQHEHQSLLRKETHRQLLDDYAGQNELAGQVRKAFQLWQSRAADYRELRDNAEEVSARYQLLSYQVDELEQLNLTQGEQEALESEQRSLAHAEEILRTSHELVALCDQEDQGLDCLLSRALHLLRQLPEKSQHLQEAEQLFETAQIQIDEARREVERHLDNFTLDPERLREVEERLSAIYEVARKHRVGPEQLPGLYRQLSEELAQLADSDQQLEALEQAVQAAETEYRQLAQSLSEGRQKASKTLSKAVNQQLQDLAMPNAHLEITLSGLGDKPGPQGLEEVEFIISTNPGQPARSLNKVASGGELSRISLAIQVVAAQTSAIPTLVFDEVDVGIGGATGDVVGRLLRQLGDGGQVLCVTHLAQVASKGHQHLQVTKNAGKKSAQSSLVELRGEAKIEEIARMLGGMAITEQSLAHAREMLTTAEL